MMKKMLALLLVMLLAVPAAMADAPHYLTTPDGLILTYYKGPSGALSTSEIFVQGLYIEENWEEAYELNLLLAEAGDTNAMVRLGDQHLSGLGVQEDAATAYSWYQRAAEQDNSDAQFCLALMYLNGWGVEADAAYAAGLLEAHGVASSKLACLYLLGYGNLEPDMEKAMYWFDKSESGTLGIAQSDSPRAASYQAAYERHREAFLAQTSLPEELFTRPSPLLWADDLAHASDAMDMGTFWRNGDGGVVDHVEAARWFEMAIEMDGNSSFVSEWSHAALGDYYYNGLLGVIDMDRASRHYAYAEEYDDLAYRFRNGVTGKDGTVHLAPDAALAEAFDALDQHREYTNAHALIGDLFRTGQTPEGVAVVTPDAYLAARFYLEGFNDPHCTAQLTEMYKAGLITDPRLLYSIANNIVWSECDVSELILLLADDLIHWRITVWKPNADSDQVRMASRMLDNALKMGKLPDPAAAEALLALIPEEE